jgi:hypothetical protein
MNTAMWSTKHTLAIGALLIELVAAFLLAVPMLTGVDKL